MSRDLAIDLGTATTLVHARGEGVVYREPTVIAVEPRTGAVHAVGDEAARAIKRANGGLVAERPLSGGAIRDFVTTSDMLALLFAKLGATRVARPRVLVGVPCGITDVERRALTDAARRAGAAKAWLIEEPLAAAIGAGMPVQDAVGTMVVDIGGGNTEVAVISLGGLVNYRAARVGGFDLDHAIQRYVRDTYNVAIGDRTAEDVKIAIGSAYPQLEPLRAEVSGRDLDSGLAHDITLEADEVRAALDGHVAQIVATVVGALSECPPELSQDVIGSGLLLVGGGALLRGLDERLAGETQVKVRIADDPLGAVIAGAGVTIDELESWLTAVERA